MASAAALMQGHVIFQDDSYELTVTSSHISWKLVERGDSLGSFFVKAFSIGEANPAFSLPLERVLGLVRTSKDHSEGFKLYAVGQKGEKDQKRDELSYSFSLKKTSENKDKIIKEVSDWVRTIEDKVQSLRPWPKGKKLLVLINPKSGRGNSLSIWKAVRRVFSLAQLPVEAAETQHAGHGAELAQKMDLSKYFGVITISGDGLLNEVINGICSRPDAATALHTLTFGIIPGGSGNGLSASLLAPDPLTAAWAIIRGATHPMDLLSVTAHTPQGIKTLWGFLSIEWAMLAIIDLESESYRFLGPLRFDLKGLFETLACDAYKGKLSFLPAPASPAPKKVLQKAAPITALPAQTLVNGDRAGWVTVTSDFTFFLAVNVKKIQMSPAPHAPHAEISDGCLDLITIPKVDRAPLMAAMMAFEDGTFHDKKYVEYRKVLAFELEPDAADPKQAPIALDGERLVASKISVENHNAIFDVFYDFGD